MGVEKFGGAMEGNWKTLMIKGKMRY